MPIVQRASTAARAGLNCTALWRTFERSVFVITATPGLMPPSPLTATLSPGLPNGPIPPLGITNRGQTLPAAARPPRTLLPLLAQRVQNTTHLLPRQLRVFPPQTLRVLGNKAPQHKVWCRSKAV